MEQLLQHLTPGIGAVGILLWAVYGGWVLRDKIRNGKNGNGHDTAEAIKDFRAALEELHDAIDKMPTDMIAGVRAAFVDSVNQIDMRAREREIARLEELAPAPGMIERLLDLIGRVPTTQARVLVTLGTAILTTLRYLLSGVLLPDWSPSYEWLGFLVVMSGLDGLQFMAKRTTDANYVAAKAGTVPVGADPKVTT